MNKALAITLVVALVAAGCIQRVPPPKSLSLELHVDLGQYTWPAPIVTDAQGNVLAGHPLASDPNLPRFVPRLLPTGGAEPNMGVTSKGNLFATSNDVVYRSKDKGGTWEVVWDFQVPGWPIVADRFGTADPMLWVDMDEDRVFVQHMHPGTFCTYLAYSDDEGQTWTDDLVPAQPGLQACTVPFNDHMKIITANHGPQSKAPPLKVPDSRLSPWSKVLHMCYAKGSPVSPPKPATDEVSGTWCAASYNSGATWTQDTKVWPDEECAPQNGHPAAYKDGTVVVPRSGAFECDDEAKWAVSEDDGLTWRKEVWKGVRVGQSEIDPDITVTGDMAYYLFRGGNGIPEGEMPRPELELPTAELAMLGRTSDKFRTVQGPYRVAPPDHVMDVFTVIGSGDRSRIVMAYLGTTTQQPYTPDKKEPSFAIGGTIWHLYITYSLNADSENPIFVTQQVTPNEDPVQVGCVWLRGGGGGPMMCRNLLDFIDMAVDKDGRAYVVFTDGCVPRNGCTVDLWAAAGQSHDQEIAVAVQTEGWSLFADKTLEKLPWEFPVPMNETGRVTRPRN